MRSNPTSMKRISDRELVMIRTFRAPAPIVFDAWTKLMPGEAVVTVSFEERDGSTTLVSHDRYPSKEVLDGAISSGMEDGARETFDQLEVLVASLLG